MEQAQVKQCDITKCPLNASLSVAESIVAEFDDDALLKEPAHTIDKQTRMARMVFDRLVAAHDCDGPMPNSDNRPSCSFNISDPMSLLARGGETVHPDGHYLSAKLRQEHPSQDGMAANGEGTGQYM